MKGGVFVVVATFATAAAGLLACLGEDPNLVLSRDAASDVPAPPFDAHEPIEDGGREPLPPRYLLSFYDGNSSTEVVVLEADGGLAGTVAFDDRFGLTRASGAHVYFLRGEREAVVRLDSSEPWKPRSSWRVASPAPDGSVTETSEGRLIDIVDVGPKAYVLSALRNQIAVIHPDEETTDGGVASWIDLSPLVSPNDGDRLVNPVSGVFDAKRGRVYVVLSAWDVTVEAPADATGCPNFRSAVTAIDIQTDSVVSMGGDGVEGSVLLSGAVAHGITLDSDGDRLLIDSGGCENIDPTKRRRVVEEVRLTDARVTTLLSLNDRPPGALRYVGPTQAAVTFYNGTYRWDPTTSALGLPLGTGVRLAELDRDGHVIGSRSSDSDGGSLLEIVRVSWDSGDETVVATNPMTDKRSVLLSLTLWPPVEP